MGRLDVKKQLRAGRARRVRATVRGTDERPRLHVTISNSAIAAQIINDATGNTIVGARSTDKNINKETASKFGTEFAKKAKKAKVSAVALDRGSRKYHGRLQAFAEAARKEGLDF